MKIINPLNWIQWYPIQYVLPLLCFPGSGNSGNNLIRQKNASFLFYKKLSRRLSSKSYLNNWGQFNLIMLEHKLLNGIHKIKSKITTQKKMS